MNRTSWRRALVWTVLAMVVAAGLVYAFLPEPVLVDLGTVARGPLKVTVDDEGETRVKEIYTVSAPITGRMLRINSKVGDVVRVDETVLATMQPIDPTFLDVRARRQAQAEVKGAEATLTLAAADRNRAQAELDFATAELKRARPLAERGNISSSALDRAEMEVRTRRAALETAEAALKVRQFDLETARAALIEPSAIAQSTSGTAVEPLGCCIDLKAPVDGQVLRIPQESEQVVTAGTPLIEVGNAHDLEIVVDLLSTDAVRIREGATVDIVGWGGGPVLPGRVRRIEPFGFTKVSALGIEEQRVNVIIDFTGDSDARAELGHGYRVEVRIEVWHDDNALTVPVAALFRDGDAWAVFALRNGRAAQQDVSIGHTNGRNAEVLGGLEAGDKVVLHPSDRVVDGIKLAERDDQAR